MVAEKRFLQLFEALELRSDYLARMATIRDCLAKESERGGRLWRSEETTRRPSPDYDPAAEREELRKLEFKQRKLNSAIQKANYETAIEVEGEAVNLLEALELRKGLNAKIAELKKQLVETAYETVIYKEGRDIVEKSSLSYVDIRDQLDKSRKAFRDLNRKLRRASFETAVEFHDE